MRKRDRKLLAVFTACAAVLCSGCSRSVMNYQIAECIGTLDQYENNEPVETPKMKAEREKLESEQADESEKEQALSQAEALATAYQYEEAISYLQNSTILNGDERAQEAAAEYQKDIDNMYEYEGDIGQLSFTNLVVDTARAFDGDEYSTVYENNMITLDEFQGILQQLYDSGYVLVDIHTLASKADANADMTSQTLKLPQGKKPLVFSVDNLSYSSGRSGDGVATKLALDEEGNVAAVYTDAEGHDLKGAYDVVPVLEQFIEEHPDFSYQGARGIISLAGQNGVFGYSVESSENGTTTDQEQIRQIAAKLLEDGWTFASAGYSYQYMGDMSYETLKEDITNWQTKVASLIGDCDTLIYPYGSEVDYTTEKAAYLTGQGFTYLIGLWPEGDHLEVTTTYLRQTRRMVTGYVFDNSPSVYLPYFTVADIRDANR